MKGRNLLSIGDLTAGRKTGGRVKGGVQARWFVYVRLFLIIIPRQSIPFAQVELRGLIDRSIELKQGVKNGDSENYQPLKGDFVHFLQYCL